MDENKNEKQLFLEGEGVTFTGTVNGEAQVMATFICVICDEQFSVGIQWTQPPIPICPECRFQLKQLVAKNKNGII